MFEQAKLERLLLLLIRMGGPFGKTLAELADNMGCSERTVYRYIQTFKDCGYVINNEDGYFRITEFEKGKKLSDLLHFSAEESELLSRAIHSIDFDGALKESLTMKLYSLYNNKMVPYAIFSPEKSENIIKICEAIRQKKQVLLNDYSSANSHNVSTRLVEPFDFTTNYFSVWCYENEKQCNKQFKVSRINSVSILDQGWEYENKHQKIFTDVFRIAGTEQQTIKLKLGIRAHNLLIEEYPLAKNFIQTLGDNFLFEAPVCSFEGAGRFVLGLFDQLEVIENENFKDFLRKKINLMKI